MERRRRRPLADQPIGRLPRPGRGEAAGGSAASRRTEPVRLSARRLLLREHDRHRSQQPLVLQVARWRSELQLHRRFSRSLAAGGLHGGSPLATRRRRPRRGALLPYRAVRSPGRRDQPRRGRDLAIPPDRRHRARGHLHVWDRRGLPRQPLLRLEGPRRPPVPEHVQRSRRHLERSTDGGASRGAGRTTRGGGGSQTWGGGALVPGNHRRRSLQRLHHREPQRLQQGGPASGAPR